MAGATARPPVVIVPGDGSNQLEARLNKPTTLSWRCARTSGWYRIWLDASDLLANTECWSDNIRLVLNTTTGESRNSDGVETRVPGFGGTASLDCLHPSLCSATAVWKQLTDALVADGYVRNASLLGAPYDFRYAPFSRVGQEYQAALRGLIERAVASAGAPAVLVSHSMGGLQALQLLLRQSQAWKDAHIREWVAIAGPWGGSNKEMEVHASGDDAGLPISSLRVRQEQRSYETNFWLLPVPRWRDARPIITTPSRNFSAQDYSEFFPAIGYRAGLLIYEQVAALPTAALPAPGVAVRCLYGRGVDTPEAYHYPNGWDDPKPQVSKGDGDGTVGLGSLRLCERWGAGAGAHPFKSREFVGIRHGDMLKAPDVIAEVLSATRGPARGPAGTRVLI